MVTSFEEVDANFFLCSKVFSFHGN